MDRKAMTSNCVILVIMSILFLGQFDPELQCLDLSVHLISGFVLTPWVQEKFTVVVFTSKASPTCAHAGLNVLNIVQFLDIL